MGVTGLHGRAKKRAVSRRRTGDAGATAVEMGLLIGLFGIVLLSGFVALQGALGSAFDSAVDEAAVPPPATATPAGAPTGLGATRGANQVSLSWVAPTVVGSGVVQYRIQRDEVVSSTSPCAAASAASEWADVVDTGSATPSYVVSTTSNTSVLLPGRGSQCCRRRRVLQHRGAARRSIAISSEPTGLTATRGVGLVSLSWTAPTYDGIIVGYRIQRQTATSSTVCGAGAWSNLVANTGSTATTYDDTTANAWYCCRGARFRRRVVTVA